jgi:hypothetical protein
MSDNPNTPQWQDMSTAPKMTHVLLWYPDSEHVVGLVNGPDHWEAVGYFGNDAPTHWMPLPPAPGESA